MDTPASFPAMAARLGAVLDAVRAARPRVHCITSPVAGERTANTLLALGAHPSLTANQTEIADFVGAADSLLVNLGMFDPGEEVIVTRAIGQVASLGAPWVLDPVFVDVSPRRRTLARGLLQFNPTVLKTNAAEAFMQAPPATVHVATGVVDRIAWGSRTIEIANGHPLGSHVTAIGCALGAVIAAFLAVERDAWLASAAAVAYYAVAVEMAAAEASGPGSFAVALIDALAKLDGETLTRSVRLS